MASWHNGKEKESRGGEKIIINNCTEPIVATKGSLVPKEFRKAYSTIDLKHAVDGTIKGRVELR